jgi:hypothetical protein
MEEPVGSSMAAWEVFAPRSIASKFISEQDAANDI